MDRYLITIASLSFAVAGALWGTWAWHTTRPSVPDCTQQPCIPSARVLLPEVLLRCGGTLYYKPFGAETPLRVFADLRIDDVSQPLTLLCLSDDERRKWP